MKLNDLKTWLKAQQPVLEAIMLGAAEKYYADHYENINFGYDLACAQKEGYNLMNGEDLCYDRYTTPLSYSMWYQCRRINVFLSTFLDKIHEACSNNQPIDIFDLGAGTGCVQFCFGLVSVAFKRTGQNMPLLRIINVDSSPFMLNYLKNYLWPHALKHYPELNMLAVEYNVCSWTNRGDIAVLNPWICASYLFDSSDNEEYLSSHFEQMINDFNPDKILMLTSSQSSKKKLMEILTKKMQQKKYQTTSTSNPYIFSGDISGITRFRKELITKFNLTASSKNVCWSEGYFTGLGLQRMQTGMNFSFTNVPQTLDLYNSPLKIRRDVVLNEFQVKAADFDTRPVIITGPAGCGKSVVITEKIVNIIDHLASAKALYILVTTFNKHLLKQLRIWITDLLTARGYKPVQVYFSVSVGNNDGTGVITIKGDNEIRIKFIHFEMLNKYIGKNHNQRFEESEHKQSVARFIKEIQVSYQLKQGEYEDVLNVDFILEEYHRVIYGLDCKIRDGIDRYQNIERKGRGNRIQLPKGRKREVVWQVLKKYAEWMHREPRAGHSFIARRQLLLNTLSGSNDVEKFDYVFVDEFQDCTPADFKIMMKLLKDVNNLVLSGDLAQAVHIGQSGIIPRDEAMANRKYYRLNGSYRLPYRISEAIQPLSKHISGYSADKDITPEMTPSKGAPPGARPLFVYASESKSLADKIIRIKKAYDIYELKMVTILEEDGELCRNIRELNSRVETSTVLKLKGLEKEMIVWSLQAYIEFENELMEFAYTIMTRTNCLLVIAVTDDFREYYRQVIKMIRNDRIIFWDRESEVKYWNLVQFSQQVTLTAR